MKLPITISRITNIHLNIRHKVVSDEITNMYNNSLLKNKKDYEEEENSSLQNKLFIPK